MTWNSRNLLSLSSRDQQSKIRVWQHLWKPLKPRGENPSLPLFSLWWWPSVLGIPWLATASLHCLLMLSHVIPSVCLYLWLLFILIGHQTYWMCMCVCVCVCGRTCTCMHVRVLVAQSCPTICNLLDYSPPGSSVHGIFQERVLEG